MGAAVIAVVFVAGLIGAPTLFGHGKAHAAPRTQQQQVASAQSPAQSADTGAEADAPDARP